VKQTEYLIGIDDTDNLQSRGTGHVARELGAGLQNAGLAVLETVTRHQLLVDSAIPYTSHNSSACLKVRSVAAKSEIIEYCRNFLQKHSAEGSDAGLCVAEFDAVNEDIMAWGRMAKTIVLQKQQAHDLAEKENLFLEGLTGEKIGVIGSLAAVGLRKEGEDGRLLWVKNLRETQPGKYSYENIQNLIHVESILTTEFESVTSDSLIELTDWTRPLMKNKKVTLIVQKHSENEKEYIVASKEFIKSITE
jgi:hypothetical protein